MSFFSRLSGLVETAARAVSDAASSVVNLDALQAAQVASAGGAAALVCGRDRAEVYGGLDISYLTPRLAVMAFPTFPTSRLRSRNDAGAVAALLSERHGEHAMVRRRRRRRRRQWRFRAC